MRYATTPELLATQRTRCESIRSAIRDLEWEQVGRCNMCSAQEQVLLAYADRYGLPLRVALCPRCGLVYLVDRLTSSGYGEFYRHWYRPITAARTGRPAGVGALKPGQARYANTLADALTGNLPLPSEFRLLDIGGSTGVVAREFVQRFGCEATVIDPAPEEIEEARRLGLGAEVATIEGWETKDRFDLILMCQTIDHLQDLRGALEKIRRLLTPEGLFYCDVLELMNTCMRLGPPQTTFKIDHCYYFLHEMTPDLFRSVGLEIVTMHHEVVKNHVGFLMRRAEPVPLEPIPRDTIHRILRQFHQIEAEWEASARVPADPIDALRRRLYRWKRRMGGGGSHD